MKKQYILAEGATNTELEQCVMHYMREGWEPIGGVAVTMHVEKVSYAEGVERNEIDEYFYQAMVKE